MCGRYAMSIDAGNISNAIAQYNLPVKEVRDGDRGNPSYNVCPTRFAPTYRTTKDHEAIVQYMSWGLIPFWTKKKADANQYKTFNARKESIISGQRLWTPVRKHSRCVVPIEGYYEWQHKKVGQSKKVDKIPYFLRRKDKKLMFLAGMFSKVNFEDTNDSFKTFTIITGPAPKQTKWLHERMPVVLTPGTKEWDAWLDNDKEWDDSLATSLAEYAKDDLEWFEVTRDVGKVTNEGEYLIKPLKHGNIGDFFGKSKKQQIKGEAGDIKKEETIDDKANEKKNTLDITKMVSTKNEKSEVKKEEDADTQKENKSDAAKGSKKVKKETDDDHEEDETKEDEEEEEIIQPGSKRPAEDDNNISQRVSREHKKPKVT